MEIHYTDQKGSAIITAIMISLLILLIGMVTMDVANNETTIEGNTIRETMDFYYVDGAASEALESADNWLVNLTGSPTTSFTSLNSTFLDRNGNPTALLEARCIEPTLVTIGQLSDPANDIPPLRHTSSPPEGSGYGMKSFEIRRFAITATSSTGLGSNAIQVGAWKVFNKF